MNRADNRMVDRGVLNEIANRYSVVADETALDGERSIVANEAEALHNTLANDIYTSVHARTTAAVATTADDDTSAEAVEFLAPVRSTLGGDSFRDGGWSVASLDRRLVAKNGLILRVPPDTPDRDPLRGATENGCVTLELPCERRRLARGCYVRHGRHGHPQQSGITRLYVHAVADTANEVFVDSCRAMDDAGIRYTAKVFNSARRCERADPIVIEVGDDGAHRTSALVVAAARGRVRPSTPGFCKVIGNGVALGELDPGSARRNPALSFGQRRSWLAAGGLIRAREQRAVSSDDRLAALREEFLRNGLFPDEPWRAIQEGRGR